MSPSTSQYKNYAKAGRYNNTGNHLSSTPSNLAPYSQAHTGTQKPGVTDQNSYQKSFYQKDAALSRDQQDAVESMTKLSLDSVRKTDSLVKGRCHNWERPKILPSNNSRASKYAPKPNRDYPKPPKSEYSISYKRRANQTPMEQAGHREYLPFNKAEFKIGAIIRMNIHKSDFKGTTKEAIVAASQASTLVESAAQGSGGAPRRPKEHRSHGDFGPIYSENRICIVVSVAQSLYSAIPLFTHQGKGLASIHADERRDWISVQDHRLPEPCLQQSEHQPLRTAYMNPQAAVLNKVSTAWIPYAVPCRFDVPVAYQGSLDAASAERLVRLYRSTWSASSQN